MYEVFLNNSEEPGSIWEHQFPLEESTFQVLPPSNCSDEVLQLGLDDTRCNCMMDCGCHCICALQLLFHFDMIKSWIHLVWEINLHWKHSDMSISILHILFWSPPSWLCHRKSSLFYCSLQLQSIFARRKDQPSHTFRVCNPCHLQCQNKFVI